MAYISGYSKTATSITINLRSSGTADEPVLLQLNGKPDISVNVIKGGTGSGTFTGLTPSTGYTVYANGIWTNDSIYVTTNSAGSYSFVCANPGLYNNNYYFWCYADKPATDSSTSVTFKYWNGSTYVTDTTASFSGNSASTQVWGYATGQTVSMQAVYSSGHVEYTTIYLPPITTTYTISYNKNGATSGSAPASQSKVSGTTLVLQRNTGNLAKEGYTTDGWATSASGAKAYDFGGNYTANAAATMYAHWVANTYTVRFNANGGSGTMADQSYTYGVSQALTANSFTKTGVTFLGWTTNPNLDLVVYTNQQSVSNLTIDENGLVILYAVWSSPNADQTVNNIFVNANGTWTWGTPYVNDNGTWKIGSYNNSWVNVGEEWT